jgi:hypothetical protein
MSFSLQSLGSITLLLELHHSWFLHRHKECRTCEPLDVTDPDHPQLCASAKKILSQRREAFNAWRVILPHLDVEMKDAWKDYDEHRCPPGEARCTIDFASVGFRPVPRQYRHVRCSLGFKLADERFTRLGYGMDND